MSIINRIESFRKHLNITQKALCSEISYPESAYTSAKKRDGEISSGTLERICTKYPELNIEWILTGNGSMIKGITSQDPTLKDCLEKKNQLTDMLLEKDAEIKRLKSNNKRISSKP